VSRLFYVSGDGQEVMPDLTAPNQLYKLPQPLIVGVPNAQCLEHPLTVQFNVTLGNGQVVKEGGAPGANSIKITTDAAGRASCDFYLDGKNRSQRVTATLLDANDNPVSLPIIFNANLSIASEVAYDPGACAGLSGQTTVQAALDQLADQRSLYKVSGDSQTLVSGGTLQPVLVRMANRCGPVALRADWISFNVLSGGGVVSATTINADGTAQCSWTLGAGQSTQELEAALQPAATPTAEPSRVVFTAQRAPAAQDRDEGIHVREVLITATNNVLLNDTEVNPSLLNKGLIVLLDGEVEQLAIRDKPTCFVTVEVPYPLTTADQDFWKMNPPNTLVGFQPLVLEAREQAAKNEIRWLPSTNVIDWLNDLLARVRKAFEVSRVLARLTLKGNVIWAAGDPKINLDGEAFGRLAAGRVDLDLHNGSGDGRRGGNFEMWFWLVPQPRP
jgi:hypothetical protein